MIFRLLCTHQQIYHDVNSRLSTIKFKIQTANIYQKPSAFLHIQTSLDISAKIDCSLQ